MMKGIKQINHYKLYKELGRSLNKTVYLAIDDRTDGLLVVKAFNNYKHLLQNNSEALEVIKGLPQTQENVLKYLGKEKTSNNMYLCVEYINGGNLAELLRSYQDKLNTPMNESEVQAIMRQLIEGFEFLEKNRVSQRDIGLRDVLVNYPSLTKKNQETTGIDVDRVQLFKTSRYRLKVDYITVNLEENATKCNMPIDLSNQETTKTNQRMRPGLWSLGSIAFELLFGVHFNKRNTIKSDKYISSEATTFIKTLLETINHTQLTWKDIKELPFISNSSTTFHMKYYINSFLDSLNSNDLINSEYYSFIDLQKNIKPNEDNKYFEVVMNQKCIEKFGDLNLDKNAEEEEEEDKWEVISVHSELTEVNDIEVINIVNNYLNI